MLRPIVVGNAIVEHVASFKFFGVYISRDLTWFTHVDYILKKANRRLYILRALRRLYQEALCQSGLAPLEVRRAESFVNFIKSVKSGNPLLPICEGLLVNKESNIQSTAPGSTQGYW